MEMGNATYSRDVYDEVGVAVDTGEVGVDIEVGVMETAGDVESAVVEADVRVVETVVDMAAPISATEATIGSTSHNSADMLCVCVCVCVYTLKAGLAGAYDLLPIPQTNPESMHGETQRFEIIKRANRKPLLVIGRTKCCCAC